MFAHIRKIFSFFSFVSDVGATFKLLLASSVGVGAVTGYIASVAQLGLHWAILIGSSVFALIAAGWFFITLTYRMSIVFERLIFQSIEIVSVNWGAMNNSLDIVLKIEFKNNSLRDIYMTINRMSISLQGRVNPEADAQVAKNRIVSIPPQTTHAFLLPVIKGMDSTKPIKGNVDFEVIYGADEAGGILFSCVAEPILIFRILEMEKSKADIPKEAIYKVEIINQIKSMSHKKVTKSCRR